MLKSAARLPPPLVLAREHNFTPRLSTICCCYKPLAIAAAATGTRYINTGSSRCCSNSTACSNRRSFKATAVGIHVFARDVQLIVLVAELPTREQSAAAAARAAPRNHGKQQQQQQQQKQQREQQQLVQRLQQQ
ncbi:hypothetical protein ACSSS7_006488 [Eimeria intestinalis]